MSLKPDYGLRQLNDGIRPSVDQNFYDVPLYSISIIAEGQYSTTVNMPYAGELLALSLDFDDLAMAQIMAQAPEEMYQRVRSELGRDPATSRTIELGTGVTFSVRARLGQLQSAPGEQFVPLVVQEVL